MLCSFFILCVKKNESTVLFMDLLIVVLDYRCCHQRGHPSPINGCNRSTVQLWVQQGSHDFDT